MYATGLIYVVTLQFLVGGALVMINFSLSYLQIETKEREVEKKDRYGAAAPSGSGPSSPSAYLANPLFKFVTCFVFHVAFTDTRALCLCYVQLNLYKHQYNLNLFIKLRFEEAASMKSLRLVSFCE